MDKKKLQIRNSTAEFLVFTKQAGNDSIEVRIEEETVWLTQKLIASLFNVNVRTISEHLQNIFKNDELDENSVIRKFRTTASDGKNYNTQFYNLDAIISVGYRVKSQQGTRFRCFENQKQLFGISEQLKEKAFEKLAKIEFEKYRQDQDKNYISDFDRAIKEVLKDKKSNR